MFKENSQIVDQEKGIKNDFRSFELKDLELEENAYDTEVDEKYKIMEYQGSTDLMFDNKEYKLTRIDSSRFDKSSGVLVSREISFMLKDNGIYPEDDYSPRMVVLGISIDKEGEITTTIGKNDEKGKLPRGLGRKLFKKSPEFLQFLAETDGKHYTHRVRRAPGEIVIDSKNVHLSNEQWDKVFKNFLEESNYTQIEEGVWTREY